MKREWLYLVVAGLATMGCAEPGSDPKECTTGTKQCVTMTSYRQCTGETWSSAIACSENQQCQNGTCVPLSECKNNTKQCINTTSWASCNNGVWSDAIACNPNYECQGGVCVPSSQTSDKCEAGFKQCTATGMLSECISGQLVTTPCPDGQACIDDTCIEPTDACQPSCTSGVLTYCVDGKEAQKTCANGCDGNACKIIGTGGSEDSTCSSATYVESCVNGVAYYCYNSAVTTLACRATSGYTCDVIMDSNYVDCFSEAQACTRLGDKKQTCSDGVVIHYTCGLAASGKMYWHLTSTEACDDGYGYCMPDGTCHNRASCSSSNYEESCNDNYVMYCSDNYVTSLACSDSAPCRVNAADNTASCTTTCSMGAADKKVCLTSDGTTFGITQSCSQTTAGDYAYFLDSYEVCANGCTEGVGCDSIPESNEPCPTDGAACTENAMGCCENNTLWECYNKTYYVTECPQDAGYYCDTQAEYNYAACVQSCDEDDYMLIMSHGNLCYSSGEMEIFVCEPGDSGNYGTFGGYSASSICANASTAITCDDVAAGSAPTTVSCANCKLDQSGDAISTTCN